MKTITVAELKKRMSNPDDRSIDCLANDEGQLEISCGECPFNGRYGCGGHSYDLNWNEVWEHLTPMADEAKISIHDLAPFLTNKEMTLAEYADAD
jgi:hypothetical protein